MKLLILGSTPLTRNILKKLIRPSQHKLEWHRCDEDSDLTLQEYDIVLVDGSGMDCATSARLIDKVRRIRNRSPRTPVVVLSPVDDTACNAKPSCGISRSADGTSLMRCRLKELAWNETAALLRDALNRPLKEPITFEYQG